MALIIHEVTHYSPFPRKLPAALKGFEEKGYESSKPKYQPLCCALVVSTKVVRWMEDEEVGRSGETETEGQEDGEGAPALPTC